MSCHKIQPADVADPQDTVRNVTVILTDGFASGYDIFIYSRSAGLLMEHRHSDSRTLRFQLPRADYSAAAISDSPFNFNDRSLEHYESAELISFRLADDNPQHPIGSATTAFRSGDTVRLHCRPLIGRIRLARVTNSLEGYTRLENAGIHLENINSQAEVFRSDGFRTASEGISGDTILLDYDIGLFTVYPDKTLLCYPDDGNSRTPANPGTIFVFECRIDSSQARFDLTLPPVRRDSRIDLSLTVNGPDDCEWEVFQ